MSATQGRGGAGGQYQQGSSPWTPHQPSAVDRTLNLISKTSFWSIVGVVAVCVLQAIMPPDAKPSALIGAFHGGTTSATLDAERESQVNTVGRTAEAQARAQAQWAMEIEVARQQQQAILESLEAKKAAANLADGICMSAPVAGWLFGRDAANYTKEAQKACGEGARLRAEIVQSQAEAARLGSAIMQRQQQMQVTRH